METRRSSSPPHVTSCAITSARRAAQLRLVVPLARRRGAVAVVASMIVLAACTGGPHSPAPTGADSPATAGTPTTASPSSVTSTATPVGVPAKVRVTNLPTSQHVEVTDKGPGVWSTRATGSSTMNRAITSASHIFALKPPGPLAQTADVEMALDRPAAAGWAAVVVTRKDASYPWTYLPASLTADRTRVRFTTARLGELGALLVNPDALSRGFKKSLVDGLDRNLTVKVSRPSCTGQQGARGDGFTITATSTDAAYWCFGYDQGVAGKHRVLKLVSRRPYVLMLRHSNMRVLAPSQKLSRRNGTLALIEPRATVLLNADLDPGDSEGMRTDFTGVSRNVLAVQSGIETLSAMLARLGALPSVSGLDAAVRVLQVPSCDDALSLDGDAVLKACFNAAALDEVLGSQSLLLTSLTTASGFGQFFRSHYQQVVDQFASRDQFSVHVKRAPTPAPVRRASPSAPARHAESFAPFSSREWGAHVSEVTISRSGHVRERIGDGCCHEVVDLEYQLSHPHRAGRGWAADATVTRVRLYDDPEGRRPRVGHTYRVRVVGPHYYGVAAPHFAFCDLKMAHWDCGA